MKTILRFIRDEDGPTTVEYAIMLTLILVGCLTAISVIGSETASFFQDSAEQLDKSLNDN